MADEVDRLFSEFFTGLTERQLAYLKWEIRQRVGNGDENIGGSRGSRRNGQRDLVEGNLIREESNPLIQSLERKQRSMTDFCLTLDEGSLSLLHYRYDKRNCYPWYEVANRMCKSERQCKRQMHNIKQMFKQSVWYTRELVTKYTYSRNV
ncbi:DUF722 domain-containing protein [Fructobacillus sp. CRL 2054]|uniref:DUF722 domain-containing protein n=1 Tax=Fructobacillus sp. CRL 2054 TaxID=2763007 RepID=UPI002378D44B|nr:DUF722 domain-containing protein [Fructobacillus sp. CRL 2054]MDD9139152.1 DUF722 domain-containing protein [Fructobacillus sp. CRL 2054]